MRDAPPSVGQALLLDDDLDPAADLLAYGGERQIDACHERHRLEPQERFIRSVRVRGGQRAAVTGVHRLEHVERLATTDLTDDDAVRTHAERGAKQRADVDRARALDARRPRLE